MRFKVEVRGAAERDVAEAIGWYNEQQLTLGRAFFEELSQVLQRLSETPFIYQVVYRDSRRAPMHRFPYLVWFKVKGEMVTVRACLRASVRPSKVRRRLR